MERINKKKPVDGWARLKSVKNVLKLADQYDEVDLIKHICTSAMFTALSTQGLPVGERHDLIDGLWTLSHNQLIKLQAVSALAPKARLAQNFMDFYARACLDVLGHYEYLDKNDPDLHLRELGNRLSRES